MRGTAGVLQRINIWYAFLDTSFRAEVVGSMQPCGKESIMSARDHVRTNYITTQHITTRCYRQPVCPEFCILFFASKFKTGF